MAVGEFLLSIQRKLPSLVAVIGFFGGGCLPSPDAHCGEDLPSQFPMNVTIFDPKNAGL